MKEPAIAHQNRYLTPRVTTSEQICSKNHPAAAISCHLLYVLCGPVLLILVGALIHLCDSSNCLHFLPKRGVAIGAGKQFNGVKLVAIAGFSLTATFLVLITCRLITGVHLRFRRPEVWRFVRGSCHGASQGFRLLTLIATSASVLLTLVGNRCVIADETITGDTEAVPQYLRAHFGPEFNKTVHWGRNTITVNKEGFQDRDMLDLLDGIGGFTNIQSLTIETPGALFSASGLKGIAQKLAGTPCGNNIREVFVCVKLSKADPWEDVLPNVLSSLPQLRQLKLRLRDREMADRLRENDALKILVSNDKLDEQWDLKGPGEKTLKGKEVGPDDLVFERVDSTATATIPPGPVKKEDSTSVILWGVILLVAVLVVVLLILLGPKSSKATEPTTEEKQEGLFAIANTEQPDCVVDVVFVHGLGGNPFSTWQFGSSDEDQVGFFWPKELGNDRPRYAIWSLGYEAAFGKWFGDAMPIEDRARNLVDKLIAHKLGSRPILFVTHSLGGLQVKEMVVRSQTMKNEKWSSLVKEVSGIVFCGTPHRGSLVADLAVRFKKLLRTTQHVEQMQFDNSALDQRNKEFLAWQSDTKTPIKAYCETKKVPIVGVVVPQQSAETGVVGASVVPLAEDHLSMVKPENREAQIYVGVREFIDHIFEGHSQASPSTGPNLTEELTPDAPELIRHRNLDWKQDRSGNIIPVCPQCKVDLRIVTSSREGMTIATPGSRLAITKCPKCKAQTNLGGPPVQITREVSQILQSRQG